jgi:hypothetical protein
MEVPHKQWETAERGGFPGLEAHKMRQIRAWLGLAAKL